MYIEDGLGRTKRGLGLYSEVLGLYLKICTSLNTTTVSKNEYHLPRPKEINTLRAAVRVSL